MQMEPQLASKTLGWLQWLDCFARLARVSSPVVSSVSREQNATNLHLQLDDNCARFAGRGRANSPPRSATRASTSRSLTVCLFACSLVRLFTSAALYRSLPLSADLCRSRRLEPAACLPALTVEFAADDSSPYRSDSSNRCARLLRARVASRRSRVDLINLATWRN